VKPSILVPFQISSFLYSSLFELCLRLGKVGPQSTPKGVLEFLRQSIGEEAIRFYQDLLASSKDTDGTVPSQVAIQFIFDVKFLQWMHLKLGDIVEPLVSKLQEFLDPFDLDIVNPRLKVNLKRFLFENHVCANLMELKNMFYIVKILYISGYNFVARS